MPVFLLYSIAGVLLFCIALYGLIAWPEVLRKIIALNVMGGGVFLFLISIARRNSHGDPDPVPQAMVLTGIVVALAITAFGVALARRLHAASGRVTLEEPGEEP
jgi:multicomponent Na+:H+ antiporter subunit C